MGSIKPRKENISFFASQIEYDYSPEYWCGWILAFYQWNTGKSFKEIRSYLPMSEIYKLYPTLHEASEEKFVDIANSILERKNLPTKLQTVRKAIGLSQKELSEKSGVTLRMIQQYEQRAKDINKAAAINLFALAGGTRLQGGGFIGIADVKSVTGNTSKSNLANAKFRIIMPMLLLASTKAPSLYVLKSVSTL